MSSLTKKYIMALSGFILVGFVIGHMMGNLQMFLHPDWINEYGYKLHNLPYGLLWIVRTVMLVAVLAHLGTGILLAIENRRARPRGYVAKGSFQANAANKSMIYTGGILAVFIVLHLAHFTVRNLHPEFAHMETRLEGVGTMHHVDQKLAALPEEEQKVHDIYSMVALGFSTHSAITVGIAVFYIVAMWLLCMHLSHGVSSMFQSLGFRNEVWRKRLDAAALVVGLVLFVGFASIPVTGLLGMFPYQEMVQPWPAVAH